MNKKIRKRIIELTIVLVALSFMAGCGKKEPEVTLAHDEFGGCTLIMTEIYEECLANNDKQGAHDVLETYRYLTAFCCNGVYYDDVKNRNYNNIQYDVGDLQIAVAAYNEYNDESATDVEVDWICQFNSCTQEQHDAIDAYVEWFYTGQYVTADGLVMDYDREFAQRYNEFRQTYDITEGPAHDDLTPEQFRDVQNFIEDPDYQVDMSLWE